MANKQWVYCVRDPKGASCSSVVQSCPTLCDPMNCITPGFLVLHHLPEPVQIHVHWVYEAIQPSHPLSPLILQPSIFPSTRVFSNELALCIRWPKYWNFSFSICPCNEYSGLISFRIDWFDLLTAQGTFKSLLQHYSLKSSIPGHSVLFMVQLSHPYMTNGKTITLMIWTSVHKVISVLFNTLSRFVIAFLFYYLFIFNWWFLYNIGLMSDLHQHELTISVQISPPSWISLPPPAHSHRSRLLQSSSFNFLSHTANCHWLLCTYVGVYASMLLCHSYHPLPLLPNPCL